MWLCPVNEEYLHINELIVSKVRVFSAPLTFHSKVNYQSTLYILRLSCRSCHVSSRTYILSEESFVVGSVLCPEQTVLEKGEASLFCFLIPYHTHNIPIFILADSEM